MRRICKHYAGVAQLVERCLAFGKGSEAGAGRLGGSLPIAWQDKQPTFKEQKNNLKSYAGVAQLVERCLAKAKVAGSNPVFRSTKSSNRGFFLISGCRVNEERG